MTKLNPTTMKTQYDGQYDTFRRKNHDYGNSFEESLDKFGIIASLVRMQDKMLRLESLTDDSKTQQVGSESLLDTLEDLSNYAAMTACWLKGVQAEDDVINKSFHAVKDLIETCDDSDVKHNELYHKRMLNSLYGAHIFRTPGENWKMIQCDNGFKPLGAEIETELPEETIGMYIDRMLSELYSRIDVWGYNDQEQYYEFVNFAETTVKEIIKNNVPISELQKHIDVFPYIYKIGDCGMEHTDDNVSHDDATDFLEKQINCAVGYMNHARAHGKISLTKDIGIYVHNIAQYALEQYTNPHRIVQHMGKILTTRSLNPNDALLLCSSVTDCIRNITNKEKGCNKAKAKDKASANKVIVMASRGSGKGLIKARSLLKELGIPEEDIKEIFEGLEEEDDE